jgi:MFS family permease
MAGRADIGSGLRGSRWRIAVWFTAAFLLLLPLIAMQVTAEVTWDETDFIVFGAMLAIACGLYELAARATGSGAYRAAVGIATAAAFILVWMNLAVGIIGSEENPLNLMYVGVLAVGIAGAAIARFQPYGMANTMVAAALTQTLVAVIAQVAGHFTWVLTAGFVALWLGSALLFRKAAREQTAAATLP